MPTISVALSVLSILVLSGLILVDGRPHFHRAPTWRGLALAIALVNGLLVVLVTEALGALGRIAFWWTVGAWAMLLAVQVPFWRRQIHSIRAARVPAGPLTKTETILLLGVGALVVGTGVVGLLSAPNTWDSITYHMSRVAHWKQNGSVSFYPTANERELFFPPFAEYAVLQLQVLTGSDRFAAMVQWLSYVGTLLGVSLIAAEFGASRRGQLMSVVFAATLPIAVLQASSTQNDMVVSFWLVCFCYYAFAFGARWSRFNLAAASAGFGLALLTKATAYVILPGFALGYLFVALRRHRARIILPTMVGLTLAAGVPLAFYVRNAESYGDPVGSPASRAEHARTDVDGVHFLHSLLRGAALHASSPPGRFHLPERVKAALDRFENASANPYFAMELDAADWRHTMVREDRAGAPLHLLVILVTLLVLAVMGRRWGIPAVVFWHILGLMAGVAMIAGYLRWNHWMVRFHMNLFLLAAPLVGLLASRIKRQRPAVVAAALLFAGSAYPFLWNIIRPVLGEISVFRTDRRDQYLLAWDSRSSKGVLTLIDSINGRRDSVIGLRLEDGGIEYPYRGLIRRIKHGAARMCHVNVSNSSRQLEAEEACDPSVILTDHADSLVISHRGARYGLQWSDGALGFYVRTP